MSLRSLLHRIRGAPVEVWLAGLGVVLLIRFPVKFILQAPFLMDFEMYRFIAERILSGEAIHLYAPTTSERMVFKFAPCFGLFLVPFGWLSSQAGAVVWSSLNVLWLMLTCWVCDRLGQLLHLTPPPWLSVAAVLILVRTITSEFLLGQINLLWGLLVVAFLFCEATRRAWRAALFLALAISLKLPALLFLLYPMVCRRWASVAHTAGWLALLNAAAAWVLVPSQPWSLFLSWPQTLRTNAVTYAFDISNQSLMALCGRLLRADGYGLNLLVVPDAGVALIALGLQLLLLAVILWPRRTLALADPARLILDGALLAILMVLCSPSAWPATYNAIFPAVFVSLALTRRWPDALRAHPPLLLSAGLALLFSALTHAKLWRFLGVPHIRGESYVFMVVMVLPLLGLSLTGFLWWWRRLLSAQPRMLEPPSASGGISRN